MAKKPLEEVTRLLVEAISETDKNRLLAVYLSAKASRLAILHLNLLVSEGTFKLKGENEIFISTLLKSFEWCIRALESAVPRGRGTLVASGIVDVNERYLRLGKICSTFTELVFGELLAQYNSSTRKVTLEPSILLDVELIQCVIKGVSLVIRLVCAKELKPISTEPPDVTYESAKVQQDLEAFKGVFMDTYKEYQRV